MKHSYQQLLFNALKLLGLIVVTFFIYAGEFALAEDSSEVRKQLFQKAQATFNQAQQLTGNERKLVMLKAASQFSSLVEDKGIENGYLLYNIGNSYHEAGEKGKAILYYKRAKRLIPGFSDLDFNLNTAKQELNTISESKNWWSDIVKSVVFWHYMFDYTTRRALTILAFISFWLVLAVSVSVKSVIIRGGVIASLAATIAFGSSFLVSGYQINVVTSGVIIEQQVQVRKGPGISYEPIYEQPLSEGTEFDLVEVHGEWWKVKLLNEDEVWVKAADAELI